MEALNVFRGDTVEDVIQLRLHNNCTGVCNDYVLEAGTEVELRFPGETATVSLSTTVVGEVTITDYNLSTLSFKMDPAKSLLLKEGKLQTINVIVTQGISGAIKTTEIKKILTVVDRANE